MTEGAAHVTTPMDPDMWDDTTDLAEPRDRVDRILQYVPRALSSHLHIVFLIGLGLYLVVLPILGIKVSSFAELVGGNYTNITSDLGACIAAGGTLPLVSRNRKDRSQTRDESQEIRDDRGHVREELRALRDNGTQLREQLAQLQADFRKANGEDGPSV
jgi:predicted phage tail protein